MNEKRYVTDPEKVVVPREYFGPEVEIGRLYDNIDRAARERERGVKR